MKTRKVLFIDARQRTIVETTIDSLEDMQKLVGGLIERAYEFDDGNEIYVNEEGLFDSSLNFGFFVQGGHQVYIGNGFLIGPPTKRGNLTDCTMSVNDLSQLIKFTDIEQEY